MPKYLFSGVDRVPVKTQQSINHNWTVVKAPNQQSISYHKTACCKMFICNYCPAFLWQLAIPIIKKINLGQNKQVHFFIINTNELHYYWSLLCLSLQNAAADTTFDLLNVAAVGDVQQKTQKCELSKM